MNGTTVATVSPLKAAIEAATPDFAASLPKAIPTGKFVRVVMDAINRNPDLRKCDPRSVVNACAKAAQDGLVLDGREAALVSYARREKGADGTWGVAGYDAQYIPMVAGLRRRIYNSGLVTSLSTGIVYRKELDEGRFEYQEGTDAFLRHAPLLTDDLGPPAVVYSVVTMANGTKSIEVMRWSEVMAIAKRSPKNTNKDGSLKGIWASDTGEMARKTALRRHAKQLPFDSQSADMFSRIDDLYEDGGEPGESEPDTPAPKQAGGAAERLRAARTKQPDPPHDAETGEILTQDGRGNEVAGAGDDDRF